VKIDTDAFTHKYAKPIWRGSIMKVVRYQIVSAGFVSVLLAGALYANHSSQAGVPADAGAKVIIDNIQAKDAIAQDLNAERLTLAEAITGFHAVDTRRPLDLPLLLPEAGGDSVEQRYSRYVIGWAQILAEKESGSETISTRPELQP